MFRNYLTTALRNLVRNKLYAAINILGLTAAFTAASLIAIFVRDELSYDNWVPNQERVYRADTTYSRGGVPYRHFAVTNVNVANQLRAYFPQIEATARYSGEHNLVRHGDIETIEPVAWADPNFFKMFPMPVFVGSVSTALSRPDDVVLTRRMARKYFGGDASVGQVLEISGHPMQVVAVLEDRPSNTNIDAEIFASSLAPFSYFAKSEALPVEKERGHQFLQTFIQLAPGSKIADIDRGLEGFLHLYVPDIAGPLREGLKFTALADNHLSPVDGITPGIKPTGNPDANSALALVAALILFAAGINFINLMTARAARRAIEVGVRKTSGAIRHDLIIQFLGESLIYVLLAFALAMIAIQATLPALDTFLDRVIVLRSWLGLRLILGIVLIVGALSVGAGAYPAFVLSSFRPAAALKSQTVRSPGSERVRKCLVILQFAVLIALCVSTQVLYRQSLYAVREGLRLPDSQTLVVNGLSACASAFEDQVRRLPGVRGASCSWVMPLTDSSSATDVTFSGGKTVSLRYDVAEPGFFDMYGLTPLAGRLLDPSRPGDVAPPKDAASQYNPRVVINETASKALGFPLPAQAIGKTFTWNRVTDFEVRSDTGQLPSEIIGVVPDFALDSIRQKIDPAFFYADKTLYTRLSIKLSGDQIPEILTSVDRLWKETARGGVISRTFVDQYMEGLYRDVTRQSQLFTIFAGVAIVISCLGLLGLSVLAAEQRTKEIGVRKAMGASRADILSLLLWEFAKPVLWANIIAWPAAYFIMHRWLEGFAYHIDLQPWMFLAASALALAIAVLTVIGHALLVARVTPVIALRYE